MNIQGILLGIVSFCIIGVWHPSVIKGEYYFGKNVCIPVFAVVGAACVIASLLLENTFASVGVALFGFSALWGIGEVREQEERVKKGWFPQNPKRKEQSRV